MDQKRTFNLDQFGRCFSKRLSSAFFFSRSENFKLFWKSFCVWLEKPQKLFVFCGPARKCYFSFVSERKGVDWCFLRQFASVLFFLQEEGKIVSSSTRQLGRCTTIGRVQLWNFRCLRKRVDPGCLFQNKTRRNRSKVDWQVWHRIEREGIWWERGKDSLRKEAEDMLSVVESTKFDRFCSDFHQCFCKFVLVKNLVGDIYGCLLPCSPSLFKKQYLLLHNFLKEFQVLPHYQIFY